MKKMVTLFLAVCILVSCSACSLQQKEEGMENDEKGSISIAGSGDILETSMFTSEKTSDNISQIEQTEEEQKEEEVLNENLLYITAGDTTFTAILSDNSSAEALKELLSEGPLSIPMRDYGNFEKVGNLGTSLPRNDEQITTGPGDVILYQGNAITIYYDTNSWNFTRLGKIENVTKEELLEAFGEGEVTVTLSMEKPDKIKNLRRF